MFRDKPKELTPYRRHFRAPLRFGAEHSAIVFPTADLDRPLPGADPSAYARGLQILDELYASEGKGFADKVLLLLRRYFVTGSGFEGIDLHKAARLFTLHPRTLNRRLRAEGTTFSMLLAEARYEIARQMLRDTHLQTSEIASALGYADSASFIHAFRRWSGITPSAWRSSHSPT